MRTLPSLAIAVGLCCAMAHAQTYTKTAEVVASGAMDAYNATHSMHIGATIGQAVIGNTGTASTFNGQGFWHPSPDAASSVEISRVGQPSGFTLGQNYPNPFDPSYDPMTLIGFSISNSSHVVLRVYTLTGTLVRTLVDD